MPPPPRTHHLCLTSVAPLATWRVASCRIPCLVRACSAGDFPLERVCSNCVRTGGRRIVVTAVMCASCALSLFLFSPLAAGGLTATSVMMFIVGMMIAGPDSVLGGVACTDVCDAAGVGSTVLTTASGVVNGVGSVGAILQGSVVLFVTEVYGWTALFNVLAVLCMVAVVCLIPLLRPRN
jgi:sugar phosphate permease